MNDKEENIAIIDLGSNSIRMLVIRINHNGSYKMIDQLKAMVRLSEGMFEDNLLKEVSMDRTIRELKHFTNILKAHKVNKTIAIATAAVRNSLNGKEFLDKVYKETNLVFNVVSGEEEAYLDYMGVINTIDIDDCIIIDTGGGSTELILVKKRKIQNLVSIPYGAVTLTEKYINNDGLLKENIAKTELFIKSIYNSIDWLENVSNIPIVGLGGSVRTLSKIHKRKFNLNSYPIHNYTIDSKEILLIYDTITNLKNTELKNLPGLKKERVDIISGGLIPLKCLVEYIDSRKLIISGNGLREGAFFKHYFEKYMLADEIVNDVLQHSIDNVLLKYDVDLQHSYHIKKISLDLFDQLDSVLELDHGYRKLLEIGSLLHDIGLYIDYYDHHCHGFYLVINSKINGLTFKEQLICAFIVGKHRIEEFNYNLSDYSNVLDTTDYETINKLSMIVRISEELSKSQNGNIKDIKCRVTKNSVTLALINYENETIELPMILQCEKDFKKLFSRNLTLKSYNIIH